MAMTANVSFCRPDALSHTPFLGLRTSVLPCLRDFRSPSSALVPVYRHRTCISCVASSSGRNNGHPEGLPQAHITALDNRAGIEDLLSLLRSKQPGQIRGLPPSSVVVVVSALYLPCRPFCILSGRSNGPGTVYLAGTGPGDPGLLTLRAVQLMQTADVVLYDRYSVTPVCCRSSCTTSLDSLRLLLMELHTCRLVSPDILRLVHDGARMVYVGKQKGFHTRTQEEIHELLCHFAMEGSSVLRLKGGDPFVFGRGGEEVQYLQQRKITTHVIPGQSASSCAPPCFTISTIAKLQHKHGVQVST